jgi:hypothetical protein
MQTFLNFSTKAKAHRAAGAQYGDARRQCEFVLFQYHLLPDGSTKARFAVEQHGPLVDRQADLAANSPDVARKYWESGRGGEQAADEEHRLRNQHVLGIGGALLSDLDITPVLLGQPHQRGKDSS